jgi:histidine triad (HIT) family protein
MSDCLFCKIVKGEIPSTKVFENDKVLGFVDIFPQAKIHLLFIHKTHTTDITQMSASPESIGEVFQAITAYTKEQGLDQKGFRVVTNTGKLAGQTVFHTHFHVISGEHLGRFGS